MEITTDTGKVSGVPYVSRARLGREKVLMCPVHLSSGGSAGALYLPGIGEDACPAEGDMVSVIRVGGFIVCFGAKSPGDPSRAPGERELFSRKKDGSKAASVLLDKDGYIDLNGNEKSLVTYAELDRALQTIWDAVKNHAHAVSGASANPSPDLAAVTLDISQAETHTIRTGG